MSRAIKRIILAAAAAVSFLTFGSLAAGQAQNQQAPVATSKLNLTMEQRHVIKEVIKGMRVESESKNVPIGVGQTIPKTVQLRAMPADISAKVSQIKSHVFFLKDEHIVLVDPKDNKVVEVVDLN